MRGAESVRIVGAGLIGTSIALGLKGSGIEISINDSDGAAQKLARDLVGDRKIINPDLVIFALPTHLLPLVINDEYRLNPNSTFIEVGSIKSQPLLDVLESELPLSQFVPTHPMAGREIGGAQSARGDLFQGRSWIYCPGAEKERLALVLDAIEKLGATPIELQVEEHDKAVALISHLPQLVASLLAKQLSGKKQEWIDLAGQGLRDSIRIAGADERLWQEIIFSNRREIKTLLLDLEKDLASLIANIEDKESIGKVIEQGRKARSLIPGKHGGKARNYTYLPIVIDDKPGQLAALFNECATMSVNVEDLSIEHSPGQFSALITLALSQSDAKKLSDHLIASGWNVHLAKL